LPATTGIVGGLLVLRLSGCHIVINGPAAGLTVVMLSDALSSTYYSTAVVVKSEHDKNYSCSIINIIQSIRPMPSALSSPASFRIELTPSGAELPEGLTYNLPKSVNIQIYFH